MFFLFLADENLFCCYVFKAANHEKAYALALSISKAFYLACQIGQEQQGLFPPTPERDLLFEPQREDDTKVSYIYSKLKLNLMEYSCFCCMVKFKTNVLLQNNYIRDKV
jgi:hypothetical protein